MAQNIYFIIHRIKLFLVKTREPAQWPPQTKPVTVKYTVTHHIHTKGPPVYVTDFSAFHGSGAIQAKIFYIDDVLIASRTTKEHLYLVLQRFVQSDINPLSYW